MAADVVHSSHQFAAGDGLWLSREDWRPDGPATAVLAVLHGYGEHGGRYRDLAEELAGLGLAVHVLDLRGHGRSAGRRGYVGRFSDYLDDTALYLDEVRRDDPDVPLFVLGHSMGGLVAACFVERRGASGLTALVLSAPFLRLGIPVPALRVAAARALSLVAPKLDIGNTLDAAALTHDAAAVTAYRSDPLNHFKAPARWAAEMLAAQRDALAGAAAISLPLLLQYGDDDQVADPEAMRELFAGVSSPDKTERAYAGYFHEIFNESGRDVPVADLIAWLRVHGAMG